MNEIERKWLVRSDAIGVLPESRAEIVQALVIKEDRTFLRIRKRINLPDERVSWSVTVKAPGAIGMVRSEIEFPVSPEPGEALLALAGDRRIAKTRYYLPGGFELDRFHAPFDDLWILELEFHSQAEAEAFDLARLPAFAEDEITEDISFTNMALMQAAPAMAQETLKADRKARRKTAKAS